MTTNVSSRVKYTYRPLQYEDEIRLEQIMPGLLFNDPMICDVIHHRRSGQSFSYEALSYVWGNASNLKIIQIGDQLSEFAVSSNCFDALHRLRYFKRSRLIWIDALCINQEDKEEKDKQIRIMGEIYARATRVIVFLGEADKVSRLLFKYIQNNMYQDGKFKRDMRRMATHIRTAAKTLIERPWFSRVWVIQEVLNGAYNPSGHETTVICGADTVSWPCLSFICHDARRESINGFESYSLFVPYMVQLGSGNDQAGLLDILCMTHSADATDPRDKLFGVQSLVLDEDKEIFDLVSYSQSTTMVYTEIAVYLLREYRLHLLKVIHHPHTRYPNMASWIPDWSRRDCIGPYYPNGGIHISEARPYILDYCILDCCKPNDINSDHLHHPILQVEGMRMGEIKSIGDVLDFESSSEKCFAGLRDISDSHGHCLFNPYLPPAFIPEYYDAVEFRHLLCEADLYLVPGFTERILHGRCLFLDSNNNLGLTPWESQAGDMLYMLLGTMSVCVLRARLGGGWTLITGESYSQKDPYVTIHLIGGEDAIRDHFRAKGVELGAREALRIW